MAAPSDFTPAAPTDFTPEELIASVLQLAADGDWDAADQLADLANAGEEPR